MLCLKALRFKAVNTTFTPSFVAEEAVVFHQLLQSARYLPPVHVTIYTYLKYSKLDICMRDLIALLIADVIYRLWQTNEDYTDGWKPNYFEKFLSHCHFSLQHLGKPAWDWTKVFVMRRQRQRTWSIAQQVVQQVLCFNVYINQRDATLLMNDLYYPLIGSTFFGLSQVHHQEHHLINCITHWYVRAIRRV